MNLTVLAAGSRGDVQPYLTLAVALQQAGHRVRFAANCNFAGLAASYNVPFYPLQVDSFAFLQNQEAQAWLEARNPVKLVNHTRRLIRPTLTRLLADAWQASQDAEAIIYHSYTMPTGYYIGRRLQIPAVPASMYPLPTRAHPALTVALPFGLGGAFNLLTHKISDQITWQIYRSAAQELWEKDARISLSTPYRQLHREQRPIVCCYSSAVLPRPQDLAEHVHITGYWFLPPPPKWTPDPALVDFLQAGSPPVYIGFGSMGNPARSAETAGLIFRALEQSGQRAILASGWSRLAEETRLPENVYRLKSAPHTWLLPKMKAIIHHGGVGTTGAGLRAGVPNIVVPHFADQQFWGRQVARLGCGPAPIPRPDLTAEKLAAAIHEAVHNRAMRQQAAAIGRQIQTEDGVGRAVRLIGRYLGW